MNLFPEKGFLYHGTTQLKKGSDLKHAINKGFKIIHLELCDHVYRHGTVIHYRKFEDSDVIQYCFKVQRDYAHYVLKLYLIPRNDSIRGDVPKWVNLPIYREVLSYYIHRSVLEKLRNDLVLIHSVPFHVNLNYSPGEPRYLIIGYLTPYAGDSLVDYWLDHALYIPPYEKSDSTSDDSIGDNTSSNIMLKHDKVRRYQNPLNKQKLYSISDTYCAIKTFFDVSHILIRMTKAGYHHGDIKLENVCQDSEKIVLIDVANYTSWENLRDTLDGKIHIKHGTLGFHALEALYPVELIPAKEKRTMKQIHQILWKFDAFAFGCMMLEILATTQIDSYYQETHNMAEFDFTENYEKTAQLYQEFFGEGGVVPDYLRQLHTLHEDNPDMVLILNIVEGLVQLDYHHRLTLREFEAMVNSRHKKEKGCVIS